MIKTKSGNILIFISLAVTMILWLVFQFRIEDFPSLFLYQLNQVAALIGTLLLSWSMFLATRLNVLEYLFDGMDGVYKSHKKVSIWGMVIIISHVAFLAVQKMPNLDRAVGMFFPIHNQIFVNVGAWSLWSFVLFVATTLLMKKIKLPYHIWKYTHKITGIALILAFVHIVLTPGLVSLPILNFWILFTIGAGIACWIYFEFLYKLLTMNYAYQISAINKVGDVFKIDLTPQDKNMSYKPGQYAYLSFAKSKIKREAHPFTITSHPDDNKLTFAIKILGDYTSTLDNLQVGDIANINGPYGNFADRFLSSDTDAVFIGGGIGIAPFMSMIKEAKKQTNDRKVSIFYCTKFKCEAYFDEEFTKDIGENLNISYINKCSREEGRLAVTEITEKIKDIKNTLVFICGPKRMVHPLEKDLILQDFSKNNIVSENFDLL